MGVKQGLLAAIISTYDRAEDHLAIGGHTSRPLSLQNGLRQGSVLSPILYLVYASELIELLQSTGTGIQITDDLKVACIMFVDDLATIASSISEINTQLQAIYQYARSHDAVVNAKKSAVASTISQEALLAELSQLGFPIKVAKSYKHLGVTYDLHCTQTMKVNAGVSQRLVAARGALDLMKTKGLGNFSPKAATDILNKTVMVIATYGLTMTDIEWVDREALRLLAADCGRQAHKWDLEKEAPNKWIMHETGIADPVNMIILNDLATLYRAKLGLLGKTVSAILLNSDKWMASCFRQASKIKLQPLSLLAFPKATLYKDLRKAAEASRKQKMEAMGPSQTFSDADLCLHLETSPPERMGLQGKRAKCLLRIRHILKFSHPYERVPCPYCVGQERHTISHVISRCQYGPTKGARAEAQRVIASRMDKGSNLTNLGDDELAKRLGGNKSQQANGKRMCNLLLDIFDTSPFLQSIL